jgi:hypothetical protein
VYQASKHVMKPELCILLVQCTYYLKSDLKELSKNISIKIYQTIDLPIVLYGLKLVLSH